jgi:hypothetical protein
MQFFTAAEQWQRRRLNRHDGFAFLFEHVPARATDLMGGAA